VVVHHISQLVREFLLHCVAEVATLRYGALENVVVGILGKTSGLLERAAIC
jgi:hypothetical protein